MSICPFIVFFGLGKVSVFFVFFFFAIFGTWILDLGVCLMVWEWDDDVVVVYRRSFFCFPGIYEFIVEINYKIRSYYIYLSIYRNCNR